MTSSVKMPFCAVFRCKRCSTTSSLQKDGITFHQFPKNIEFKNEWTKACNRHPEWTPTRTSSICSRHFTPSHFLNLSNKKRRLTNNAIPTLFLSSTPKTVNVIENNREHSDVTMTSSTSSVIVEGSVPGSSNQRQIYAPNKPEELSPRKRKLTEKIGHQSKKIKRLQSKTRYLKKKVATLEELLKTLDEKALIDKEQKHILQNIGIKSAELLKRQLNNSVKGKITRQPFSPELRCFALTLHYYSPKAYRYVRKTFGTSLPHPRTITKWYSNINGRPGFTQEALNSIKSLKEANPNKKIFCTLVLDEMKIKDFPEWDKNTQRHFGHVDYGFDHAVDGAPCATDALVFLLVGINTTWKVPIGYFLIKGTSAKLRAQLVTTALQLVHKTGVEIKALTCDGTKTNINMAEELGCNIDPNHLQTTIVDPETGQKVHFFLDPCHMLKLIRNTLEFYGCFYDSKCNIINWNYITNLHKLQEEELFHLANKLRSNHIYFKTKIMNVRLATQLFSESVANALTFCESQLHLKEFKDINATAEFLKLFNDAFDILDSQTCGLGLKKAMSLKNYEKCFERLEHSRELIMNLFADVKNRRNEIERVHILKSPRYTGFLGFLICISSSKALFSDLILNPESGLSYLPLHKISQDHVEIFFSNVRSHGGFSDNPTAKQFESIYKKLLIHKELIHNEKGTNCVPLEEISILNCSSAIEKINVTSQCNREDNFTSDSKESEIDLFDLECQIQLSPFGEKVVEYIAGYVAFSLSKKIKCDHCIKGLFGQGNDKSLTYHKTKGYLAYASDCVISICQLCEKIIRQGLDAQKRINPKYTPQFIVTKSLPYFVGKDLFPDIESHDSDAFVYHKIELAKAVIMRYTNTRLTYLSKKSDAKKCIRHIYTKLIHFKNQ